MFKGLLQLVVLAILTYIATSDDDKPKVWSGNLQFSEEGFLKDDDVRRIQKEIQMVEIDCGNVCDTSGRESTKVKEGRYKIDELTKDVDCDVLFESSYLDGVYPKTIVTEKYPVPRLNDLPKETLDKWTLNGKVPKVAFHVDDRSCPWKDQGPSAGWGLDDFQRFNGDLWSKKEQKYLWTEELITALGRAHRKDRLFNKEQGRAANERSQYVGGMIASNKLVDSSSKTWTNFPSFQDLIDDCFREGFMFGIHNRKPHLLEFEEHITQHILNRTGSEKWGDVKHVLVLGSKMPWVEAILLEKGVERVTSLVHNPEITKSLHPNITIVSHSDLSKMWSEGKFEDEQNKFDAIIAYNTLGVWHGIGGFGHPGYSVINPWADSVTLSKAWCLSKKQSRAMIALPMTHEFLDLIAFNAGKFYGRHQLAHLFTNWKQAPEDYDYVETMKKYFTATKKNTDNSDKVEETPSKNETCNKEDGTNCSTSDGGSVDSNDTKPIETPFSLGGLPIYILEKP